MKSLMNLYGAGASTNGLYEGLMGPQQPSPISAYEDILYGKRPPKPYAPEWNGTPLTIFDELLNTPIQEQQQQQQGQPQQEGSESEQDGSESEEERMLRLMAEDARREANMRRPHSTGGMENPIPTGADSLQSLMSMAMNSRQQQSPMQQMRMNPYVQSLMGV